MTNPGTQSVESKLLQTQVGQLEANHARMQADHAGHYLGRIFGPDVTSSAYVAEELLKQHQMQQQQINQPRASGSVHSVPSQIWLDIISNTSREPLQTRLPNVRFGAAPVPATEVENFSTTPLVSASQVRVGPQNFRSGDRQLDNVTENRYDGIDINLLSSQQPLFCPYPRLLLDTDFALASSSLPPGWISQLHFSSQSLQGIGDVLNLHSQLSSTLTSSTHQLATLQQRPGISVGMDSGDCSYTPRPFRPTAVRPISSSLLRTISGSVLDSSDSTSESGTGIKVSHQSHCWTPGSLSNPANAKDPNLKSHDDPSQISVDSLLNP
jgi:hypothetical protein